MMNDIVQKPQSKDGCKGITIFDTIVIIICFQNFVTFSEISQFIFLKKDCIDLVLCLQYKLSLCFVLYNEIKQNIYVL